MHNHRQLLAMWRAGALSAFLVLATGAPRAASAHELAVKGTWQQLINCAPTSYNPLTKQLNCVGVSLWQGTWNGTTHYTFDGTYDLVTGDNQGTVHELFQGKASDGTSGTLTFVEHATTDGATGKFHIDAAILSGTEGFAGSTGSVAFDGTDNAITGSGTYAGTWRRPPADLPSTPANTGVQEHSASKHRAAHHPRRTHERRRHRHRGRRQPHRRP